MKKITVDAYSAPPLKFQAMTLEWVEDKQKKTLPGYVFIGAWIENNVTLCEMLSPKSLGRTVTTFQALCRDFNWEGKTKKLCEHYEVK
ncbi:hypothetical protein vBKpnAMK6_00095 [Klebsiella phage vB_Kpn_AM_K6]